MFRIKNFEICSTSQNFVQDFQDQKPSKTNHLKSPPESDTFYIKRRSIYVSFKIFFVSPMCVFTGVKLYINNTYETGRYINMARFVDFVDLNNVMFLSKIY